MTPDTRLRIAAGLLGTSEAEARPSFVEYERRKGAWHALNPNASPQDVEAARRRIAQELGV